MAEKENPGALAGATGAEVPCYALAADTFDDSTKVQRIKARAVNFWRWITALAARVAT